MQPRTNRSHTSSTRRVWSAALAAVVLALAAPAVVASESSTSAAVTNEAPAVASVTLYTSDPSASVTGTSCPAGTTSVTPSPASTRTIYVCAVATDANGWQDVCNGGSTFDSQRYTVYAPDGVTALAENYARSNIQLTCGTGSGTTVTLAGSFVMEYWRPAAGTEQDIASGYLVSVSVSDINNATASGTQRYHYGSIKSIGSIASINFGSMAPGGNATRAVTIVNEGNAAFALDITGANFTSAQSAIAASQVNYGQDAGATAGALSTSAARALASVAAATSDSGSSASLNLRLNVPSASGQYVPAEAYSATLRFTAS